MGSLKAAEKHYFIANISIIIEPVSRPKLLSLERGEFFLHHRCAGDG